MIMKPATSAAPMIEALMPLSMASCASDGPTSYCSLMSSGRSRGLFRTLASSMASRCVNEPVISALPLGISSWTEGAE